MATVPYSSAAGFRPRLTRDPALPRPTRAGRLRYRTPCRCPFDRAKPCDTLALPILPPYERPQTTATMAARPTTPASPKNVKIKSPTPGTPLYGCEHIQKLFTHTQETTNTSVTYYKNILRCIFDNNPLQAQTTTGSITTLTPNYLCLQCPTTLTPEDALIHGSNKSHRFCMLSAVQLQNWATC